MNRVLEIAWELASADVAVMNGQHGGDHRPVVDRQAATLGIDPDDMAKHWRAVSATLFQLLAQDRTGADEAADKVGDQLAHAFLLGYRTAIITGASPA